MIVLGIDPGSLLCGYGAVRKENNKIELLEYGVINLKKISPDLPLRIKELHTRIEQVVLRCNPSAVSMETIFYAKNVQSIIKLAHARGVAMLSPAIHNIDIFEYSPKEIKKSVTGKGSASKEQVQFMIKSILKIDETPEFFDATDALAIALCHCYRSSITSSKVRNWKEFLENNPGRIIG
jgi:crossover junction endodeoxyribonuclease RuvC